MFEKATPESVGVSSEKVLGLIKNLEECRFRTHSIFMAKGDKVFAETYYKPFDKDTLHRMYSVSKTFVAMAIGVAVTEGLVTLDDVIVDYFPEFRNENIDDGYEECTIRDMLSMKSNIADSVYWWGRFPSRVEAYYSQKTNKIPGTLYYYDSIGSFLLGCIIEKLTGKGFLEYLKEKVLLDIGFSKESYVLKEPGGYTVGDSGVMCTTRDLALFARFIMQKGHWNGKQYIDRDFMENAITKQADNDLDGAMASYNNKGYGYLMWISHETGFSLVGLGTQLAICDMEKDFLFVITSDDQLSPSGRPVLYWELCKHFIPYISDNALEENKEANKALEDYCLSRNLICRCGQKTSPWASRVNNVRYDVSENDMGISEFCLNTSEEAGCLDLVKDGKKYTIEFNIGSNKLTSFSFGDRPAPHMMGINEKGKYKCAVSGAWAEENTFVILLQVIDTYLGGLNIRISFKDKRASVHFSKNGQYVFDGIGGYLVAKNNN